MRAPCSGGTARARKADPVHGLLPPEIEGLIGMSQKLLAEHGGELTRGHGETDGASGRRAEDRERRARPRARRARSWSIAMSSAYRTGSASRKARIPSSSNSSCAAPPPGMWTLASDVQILHGRRICRPKPLARSAGSRRVRLLPARRGSRTARVATKRTKASATKSTKVATKITKNTKKRRDRRFMTRDQFRRLVLEAVTLIPKRSGGR